MRPGTRTVEVSTVVPLEAAQDMTALSQVIGATLERLQREIGGRTLVRAAGARMRVTRFGEHGTYSAPWRYGLPLPEDAAMLVCVADAEIEP